MRCLRPFPRQLTHAPRERCKSAHRKLVSFEARSPI